MTIRIVTRGNLRQRLGTETKNLAEEKMFLVADENTHNKSFFIVHPSVFESFKGTQLYEDVKKAVDTVNKKITQRYRDAVSKRKDRV